MHPAIAAATDAPIWLMLVVLFAFALGVCCGGILMFLLISRERRNYEPMRDYFETDGMV